MLTLKQQKNLECVNGDVMHGPYKKPSIRQAVIRSGYRGTVRARIMYLNAFGFELSCSSLEDALYWLRAIYRQELKRYERGMSS